MPKRQHKKKKKKESRDIRYPPLVRGGHLALRRPSSPLSPGGEGGGPAVPATFLSDVTGSPSARLSATVFFFFPAFSPTRIMAHASSHLIFFPRHGRRGPTRRHEVRKHALRQPDRREGVQREEVPDGRTDEAVDANLNPALARRHPAGPRPPRWTTGRRDAIEWYGAPRGATTT
jgi:hypothetical protein